MITYLENILGVTAGTLSSDAGIVITSIIAASLVFAFLKLFILWFEKLFGGN